MSAAPEDFDGEEDNNFEHLHALGYRLLVPVVPGVGIHPESSCYARRGKGPGLLGSEGWYGMKGWQQHVASDDDLVCWHLIGAGTGIRTGLQPDGTWLGAVDADTLHPAHALTIASEVLHSFPGLPMRVGNRPKALFPLRLSAPLPYMQLRFKDDTPDGGLVEILGEAKHFVAAGIHPKTERPYAWPDALVPYADLPVFAPAEVEAFLNKLRTLLPPGEGVFKGAFGSARNPAALRGNPDLVRKAVEAIPNTSRHFPSRRSWIGMGCAIRAAVQDEFVALEIWSDWSAKWKEGTNDPDDVADNWRRILPPFQIGAGWIYDKADALTGSSFRAESHHEDVPKSDPPQDGGSGLFGQDRRTEPDPPLKITATPFVWRDPSTFPRRRWLYGSHLIRKFVSCTVAPGGVGKSSLVLVEAIAMVTGRPLLGVLPAERPLRVWVINLEDPQEEIERRVLAILVHYGIDPAEVEGRLYIDSGRRLKVVVAEQTKEGTQIAVPIVNALREEIQAREVDVVVLDPFVKAHRVPENDNGAIDAVCTVFADLADLCDCAFDLVHHVRKTNGAEVTVEDGRGAVALLGAVRSARALNGMSRDEAAKVGEGTSAREFFRVDNGKLNMAPAPPDRAEWFRLVSVPLGNGDSVQCVVAWRWPDAMAGVTAEHLRAVQVAVASGKWRENHQAKEWVGLAVAAVLGLDVNQKASRAKVLGLVKAWIKSGALVAVDGQDERRKPVQFIEVGAAA